MATDFFERQAQAHRNTAWLVGMFVLAVVCLVLTTVVVTGAAIYYGQDYDPRLAFQSDAPRRYPWEIPVWAGAGALALIGGGSLYKIAQLAGGGTVVAERLGGRRVFPNTTDLTEKRVLNVVEEMALASGVPVPPVFMLNQEEGINAFAAGFSSSDAVIGITRGCAEQLSRDELQGVIAHEFSHILNGDMRLNLRLIGVVHGILLLGLVGRELLYAAGRGGGGRSRRNSGVIYIAVIGLAVMVIGFLGTFFGNLIKAAISRQREFLADASAVQFTRNPGGIAGALKQIGAAISGSRIHHAHAAEASHMFFSQGVWQGITGLMATHPPLAERIRRIDSQWDGKFPTPPRKPAKERVAAEAAAAFVGSGTGFYDRAEREVITHAAEQVASPTEVHRRYVAELIAAMPQAVVEAAHDPYGARALIYATLLDRDADTRATQLRALEQNAEPNVFELTLRLVPQVIRLNVRARLPLVDMTLPALRALSPSQYQDFSKCFHGLVQADERVALFEWTLHQILLRHLRPQFEPVRAPQTLYYGLQRLAEPCSVLLSVLARASQSDDQVAFDSGARHLTDVAVRFLPPEECTLRRLNDALRRLAQVGIKQRQKLVDACAATVCADADVCVQEAELLRAICDMLDCPMPPLLPGQMLSPPAHLEREHSRV